MARTEALVVRWDTQHTKTQHSYSDATQLTDHTTITDAFDERAAEMSEYKGKQRCTFPKCGSACVGVRRLSASATAPVVGLPSGAHPGLARLVRPAHQEARRPKAQRPPPPSLSASYARHNGEPCPYCDRDMDTRSWSMAPSTDHLDPVSRGGSNSPENKLVVCRGCNEAKSGRTLEEFLTHLKDRRDPRAAHVQRVVENRQPVEAAQ